MADNKDNTPSGKPNPAQADGSTARGGSGANPPVDPALVALLVCPEDKGPMVYLAGEAVFLNPRLNRTYPVREGIPVMLVEESTTVDDAEVRRLTSLAS